MVRACLGEMMEGTVRGLYENATLKAFQSKTAIPREQFLRDFGLTNDSEQIAAKPEIDH